jgi:Xaa-Pro dipeptidase
VHDSLQLLRTEYLAIPAESLKYPSLFRYLRIRRPLEENMVLTVEPGCYFSPNLLKSYGVTSSPLVDQSVLQRYAAVGGVRIEDVIVVTANGSENLTTVGRDVAWVENVCSGA